MSAASYHRMQIGSIQHSEEISKRQVTIHTTPELTQLSGIELRSKNCIELQFQWKFILYSLPMFASVESDAAVQFPSLKLDTFPYISLLGFPSSTLVAAISHTGNERSFLLALLEQLSRFQR